MKPGFSEFYLKRLEDETGISGTGIVARGCIFPSGSVVMEWQTFHSSICLYKNIADVESIHGHNGKTILVMGSPPSDDAPKKRGAKRTMLDRNTAFILMLLASVVAGLTLLRIVFKIFM